MKWNLLLVLAVVLTAFSGCRMVDSNLTPLPQCQPLYEQCSEDEALLDDAERRVFQYFWDSVFPETGISWDHSQNPRGKVAATGFQLAALCIGIERGWLTYDQGYERTLQILNTFYDDPADPDDPYVDGHFGLYWHFVDGRTGRLDPVDCVALCDSADFLAGVVVASEYFKGTPAAELAQKILDAAEWDRFVLHKQDGSPELLSFGWVPKGVSENYREIDGLLPNGMAGFVDNSLLIYVLALGSGTHPIPVETWNQYVDTYTMGEYGGYPAVMTGSGALFSRQIPHSFVRFSRKRDAKIDYFAEMSNKLLADRAYNMKENGYPPTLWGLTDCFGKDSYTHGAPPGQPANDGTIATTGFICGLPYVPQLSLDAMRYVKTTFGKRVYGPYGFTSSVNPKNDYVSEFVVGIEAGPIMLMIENYRTGMIWDLFSRSMVMRRFLQKAKIAGVVDDFELPAEAVPYATWNVMGADAKRSDEEPQSGQRCLAFDVSNKAFVATARLTENDLLAFDYSRHLSLWTRDLELVGCRIVLDGREHELSIRPPLAGLSWNHYEMQMPPHDAKAKFCALTLQLRAIGARPALDNITLEAEADTAAPEQIVDLSASPGELGGTVRLKWTAPEDRGGDRVARYIVAAAHDLSAQGKTVAELRGVVGAGGTEDRWVALEGTGTTYVTVMPVDTRGHAGPSSTPVAAVPNPAAMNRVAYDFESSSLAGWSAANTNWVLSLVRADTGGSCLQLKFVKGHAWDHLAVEVDPARVALHRYLTLKVKGRVEILGKLWCDDEHQQDLQACRSESDTQWTTMKFDTMIAQALGGRPVRKIILFIEPGLWDGEGTIQLDDLEYSNGS